MEATMTQVRVEGFTISADGFGAGPNQSLQNPLGEGAGVLHQWLITTATFKGLHLTDDANANTGSTGIDDEFAARGFKNFGAWILGRNMFCPSRGEWSNLDWKGWWGDNPPYHAPTFILSHYPRDSIEMEGGTTFHFVTGGIEEALTRAKQAANGLDVRIVGGVNTIQQYLQAGLIDELHIAVTPIFLGSGEHLFNGINMKALGYQCVRQEASENATHMILRRSSK